MLWREGGRLWAVGRAVSPCPTSHRRRRHPLLPLPPPPCRRSMEGAEFATDEQNLAAWHRRFRQHHCWAVDVGPATFIGLSTTRFRRLVGLGGAVPGRGRVGSP